MQALYMSMDLYLQGLFSLVKDPSADVRKLVCRFNKLLFKMCRCLCNLVWI
jgi:hypothetical protein